MEPSPNFILSLLFYSSLPFISISFPHISYVLNNNSLTSIDMGNITPSNLFVSIIPPLFYHLLHSSDLQFNNLTEFLQDEYVVKSKTLKMTMFV